MAMDFSKEMTVLGNYRAAIGTVTASGVTSGAFETGLGYVVGGSVTKLSWTSTLYGQKVAFNVGSGGTSINGEVQIKSCTAGDTFSVIVWGQ